MPHKISIIIPTYNGWALLRDCLESLGKQTRKDFETIVVDNASQDGTSDNLSGQFPAVRVIRPQVNLGFAPACNRGAEVATGEYLLFLNNDTVQEPQWLEALIGALERTPQAGVCAGKVRLMSDTTRLDSIGSYLTPTGFLRHEGLLEVDNGQYDQMNEIFAPKGVAFAIRTELFRRLGGFDDRFFAYFEESDLFWRVWLSGSRICMEPHAVIYHKVGATVLKLNYAFVNFHNFKNRICSILKNAQGSTLIWMLPLHLACCLGLAGVGFLSPKRWAGSYAILRAIGWNVRQLSRTWQMRRIIQKSRALDDKTLFRMAMKQVPIRTFFRYTWWLIVSKERMRDRIHGASKGQKGWAL